jgi:hypothetical protein
LNTTDMSVVAVRNSLEHREYEEVCQWNIWIIQLYNYALEQAGIAQSV